MTLCDQALLERTKRIGASDVPAVLGIDPFRGRWELAAEKRGELEPWEGNAATQAGNIVEPGLLDQAESDLGPLRRQVVTFAKDVSFPLSATTDGIPDGDPPAFVVEAKSSGITGPLYGDWGYPGTDEIPDAYLLQVQTQMICTGAELAYVYALLGGRGLQIYTVPFDTQIAEVIKDGCGEFWERYVLGDETPDEAIAPPLAVLKRLRRTSDKIVELASEALDLWMDLEQYREAAKRAKESVEQTQAQLIEMLGDAEIGRLPTGEELTFFETTRKGYQAKESKFRTLRRRQGDMT